MDPLFDLVRDRTQDLRRTAEAARRERELRGSASQAQDQGPWSTARRHAERPGLGRGVRRAVRAGRDGPRRLNLPDQIGTSATPAVMTAAIADM